MTHPEIICAISTPPGTGGIAVARVSGPGAIALVDTIWQGKPLSEVPSHTAHLGTVTDTDGSPLDQSLATVFRAPGSFTGQDTVEISVHGSRFIQRRLLKRLTDAGARLAEPGEFTRLAFAAGHLDLAQAEAVADIIAADSRAAHRIAMTQMRGSYSRRLADLRSQLLELASLLELELDFSEEDVEFASRDRLYSIATETLDEISRLRDSFQAGQAIRDGIPVAIVGATNAGKSSLLNALLADNRAIVSDIHGTTRDTIEETITLGDYTFRLIDTAGLRDTTDPIEQAGIERSREAVSRASIAILVIDPAQPLDPDTLALLRTSHDDPLESNAPRHATIVAVNKADIHTGEAAAFATRINDYRSASSVIIISTKTGQGIDTLRATLIEIADKQRAGATEDLLVTNVRHARALADAAEAMFRVVRALAATVNINGSHSDAERQQHEIISGDLIAIDLREALHHLAAITGEITTPDILASIFSRFCVGK